MRKFGFVILHYMALDMTIECVEQILKLFSNNSIKIIIVDNASSNGSGLQLREKYKNNEFVEVLINHKNLGFAQGNNLGYLYLKANYNCDFIIIMNNDVIIEQQNFLDKIQTIYQETQFAVLGPDIYSPKLKGSQSPHYRRDEKKLYGMSIDDVKSKISYLERVNNLLYYYWLRHLLFGWVRKFIPRRLEKCENSNKELDYCKNMENVVLHGACLIFSIDFIKKRKLAFNPDTFLYSEEDILHYECKKQNLKILFSPEIKVIHLEDVSTDSVYKSTIKKTKFINKYLEQSTKLFFNILSK